MVAWRAAWASAFELRLNQTIRTSKDLAVRLAELASDIRARVNQLLKAEDETGAMRAMLAAFRKNLIHDLDEDGFVDMFAQTIAYGMLAARISRPMGIIADNLADMVPKTNPFLKELFGSFLKIGGRDKRRGLDFDELGVRDVVDLLKARLRQPEPQERPGHPLLRGFHLRIRPGAKGRCGHLLHPACRGRLHRPWR